MKVEPPDGKGPSTVRLFYVAENVSRTYLSLATLKALGIVGPDFPRWPASTPRGAPYSRMTATQGAFQSLGQPGEYGSNTHQRTFDTNSAAGTSSQQSPAMDVPQPPVGPPSGPAHLCTTVTQGTFQSLGEPGGLCSNNVTNPQSLRSVAGASAKQEPRSTRCSNSGVIMPGKEIGCSCPRRQLPFQLPTSPPHRLHQNLRDP